jgi:hypothetical protein
MIINKLLLLVDLYKLHNNNKDVLDQPLIANVFSAVVVVVVVQ